MHYMEILAFINDLDKNTYQVYKFYHIWLYIHIILLI